MYVGRKVVLFRVSVSIDVCLIEMLFLCVSGCLFGSKCHVVVLCVSRYFWPKNSFCFVYL